MDLGSAVARPRSARTAYRATQAVRALFVGGLLGLCAVSCDANDDSDDAVVRAADCSMCSGAFVSACQDLYVACLTDGGETSKVCQSVINRLCAADGGPVGDAATSDASTD